MRSESSRSPNRTPRKRLLNILLNSNSTTEEEEEDTEEEITHPGNKRTKRRRRNFSSSTSSSYTSSSLTTNSNNTSSVAAGLKSVQSTSVEKDLIAYRTRSRTQSIEHLDIDSVSPTSTKGSIENSREKKSHRRSSSKHQIGGIHNSDKDVCESARLSGSDKFITTNNKKTISESVNNCNNRKSKEQSSNSNQQYANLERLNNSASADKSQPQKPSTLRNLRSSIRSDQVSSSDNSPSTQQKQHNLRRKTTSSSSPQATNLPKKRQRISDINIRHNNTTAERHNNTGALDTTANTSKTFVNLGARLARGRDPHFEQQDLLQPSTSSNSSNQQNLGIPPTTSQQNQLRRSSRGKSLTTGSCVSI